VVLSVDVPELTCGMNDRDAIDELVAQPVDDAIIAHHDLTKLREAPFPDRRPHPWFGIA
jgi:hypothetical protein